jgi:hypothetical protein
VCQASIPEGVGYKEHIASEQHKRNIEMDKLYNLIDDVINELSLNHEIDKLRKP